MRSEVKEGGQKLEIITWILSQMCGELDLVLMQHPLTHEPLYDSIVQNRAAQTEERPSLARSSSCCAPDTKRQGPAIHPMVRRRCRDLPLPLPLLTLAIILPACLYAQSLVRHGWTCTIRPLRCAPTRSHAPSFFRCRSSHWQGSAEPRVSRVSEIKHPSEWHTLAPTMARDVVDGRAWRQLSRGQSSQSSQSHSSSPEPRRVISRVTQWPDVQ